MADPLRVLYVDDEPILLKTGKFYLERKGEFAVDTLTSAKEAFIQMETERYDAIISDYQMPGMDGIEFLKKIRASGTTIPFILFTGKSREEVVITALNEGADFYLQKGGEPEPLFAELAHKTRSAVERHAIDKALQMSEEKYRRIVETSHEGIWAMDGQFVTTYVNERTAEMLGYPVNEILGKTIQSFMSGEDLADQQQKIEERRHGQPGSYERRFRAKDGTILTFNVSATPLMGDGGSFKGSFAMLTDITARKRAEEELLKNAEELHASYEEITATEEELRANLDEMTRQELELKESKRELTDIIEFLPDATFVVDRQGVVIAWNRAIEEMTGISKVEMIGQGDQAYTIPFYGDRRKHLLDLIDLEVEELQATYQHVTKKGNTLYAETFAPALFGGKGAYVWVTGSPLFDLQGNRIGAIESIRDITGRRQAEEAITESRRQLDSMATNIPGVVFRYYVNPDGTSGFDYISARSREILGLENDKATFDDRFTEGIVPENRELFLSSIQHAVTTKTLWEFDSPYVKPSGEKIWVSAVSSPIMEHDRLVFDGAFFDITERKRAEEELVKKNEELNASYEQIAAAEEELRANLDELTTQEKALIAAERETRESRDMMRAYLDHSYDAVFIHDNAGKVLDVNATTLRLYRVTRKEALGYTIADYTGPAYAMDKAQEHWERVLAGEDRFFPWQARRPHDGSVFDVEVYLTPITLDDRQIILANIRDITERKQAEEEIEKKNEELRAAYEQLTAQEEELRAQYDMLALTEAEWESTFNAISDWITLISPDGRILRTNKAAESMFGTPTGQVLGLNCFELVHGAECLNDDCPRKRMLVTKKRETTEIPMREGNGWLQVTVDPILNSAGEVVSAVHIVRDISERMRSQKAMVQAKKKLNLLNYVTFNDIQNLIFTLSGYQHLAKKRETEGAAGNIIGKQEEILQKISQSLKFAQSFQDLGLKPPRWQNVNQVFLLAISHLDFLRIHHTVQLDGLEVFADPLLEQAFQILADNTLTHGTTATHVTLRYAEGPESVTLFFEDDGAGIPSDTKEKIFLPDFQKKKGVGLFLAAEILDITGITIRETGEPGKGARFEMTVPKGAWRIAEVK